jgi:hypothetical protein
MGMDDSMANADAHVTNITTPSPRSIGNWRPIQTNALTGGSPSKTSAECELSKRPLNKGTQEQ